MAGPMNQANFSYFVQKDLSEHFGAGWGDFESMIPALFTRKTPDQAIVYEVLVGDLGTVPVFDGEVSYDDSKQSYRKSTEEVEYAYGIKTTKKLRRNDLYGIVQDQARLLGGRFRAVGESIAAGIFNGAFGTTTTADTLSLCNSAHTSDQTDGANQSNTGTSAFSPSIVESMRRNMIKFKSNRNNILPDSFPDLLLGPTELEEKFFEINKSGKQVGTALNNANWHEGKWKTATWHNWLSDTDNFFLINSKQMKRFLKFYEWNTTEFFFAGEVDTLVTKHVGYRSFNVSAADWRWVFGQNPA